MLVFERFGQVQQMISEGLLNAQLSTPYGKKLFESQQIQTQKVELQKKIKE
jgi:hypothetical protein